MSLGLEVLMLSGGSHVQQITRLRILHWKASKALTRSDWPGNIRDVQKDGRSVDARLIDIQAFRLICRDLWLPMALEHH